MLVTASGEVAGSLSGGCVEGAVFEACLAALESGVPSREHYGLADDDAFAVSLPCGGTLEVLIQPFYPPAGGQGPEAAVLAAAARAPSAALVRRIDDDAAACIAVANPLEFDPEGIHAELVAMLGDASVARSAAAQLGALIRAGHTGIVRLDAGKTGCSGHAIELLVETRIPAPRLVMFGANDFSAALGNAAALLGFDVALCDARAVFATRAAFPRVDELAIEQPHRYLARMAAAGSFDGRSAICLLTHDEKFDIPVLETALRLDVGYVGAMGSRRSHDRRMHALKERGVDMRQLARLHSPIGLDIGAVSPEEVAVSIVAEIVAESRGRAGAGSLCRTNRPIHGESGTQPGLLKDSLH